MRRAVLDAAADLFAGHGVSQVSLREIAAAADVQVALINRYIGTRDELLRAVFDDLSAQLAAELVDRPTEQVSFERDSTMGRWMRVLSHLALTGQDLGAIPDVNPVRALAAVVESEYGLDDRTGRLRGAQVAASALGWRLFEDYLVAAGALTEWTREELRDELTATHRRVGATPWPSPPDPPRRAS